MMPGRVLSTLLPGGMDSSRGKARAENIEETEKQEQKMEEMLKQEQGKEEMEKQQRDIKKMVSNNKIYRRWRNKNTSNIKKVEKQ